MVVYGIWQGCIHEGGGCHSELYQSFDKCLEVALGILQEKINDQLERTERLGDETDFYKDHQWGPNAYAEAKGEYFWSNGIDGIRIQEFKIVD